MFPRSLAEFPRVRVFPAVIVRVPWPVMAALAPSVTLPATVSVFVFIARDMLGFRIREPAAEVLFPRVAVAELIVRS